MKAFSLGKGFFFVLFTLGMIHFFSARGQGLILFFNNNLTAPNGEPYRAGIYQDNNIPMPGDPKGDSTVGAGAGFTAGLFLANDLSTPLATTTFRTTSAQEVFIESKVVKVPGVPAGQAASFVVRAWRTSAGSYDASDMRGEQQFTSRPLGETVPVDMGPGFTGFEMNYAPLPSPPPAPVANASFEDPSILNGHVQFGTTPASWTVYNAENLNGSTDAVGVMNATGTQQYPAGVPSGRNAALVHLSGPGTGEAGLQTSIYRPGEFGFEYYKLTADTVYIVRVRVGNPASGMSGIGHRNLDGFPGYRVDLLSADGTVLASDNNMLSIGEGEFKTSTVEFAVGATHPKIGQGVQIRLVNLNQQRAGEPRGFEVNFDAVTFAIERVTARRKAAVRIVDSNTMSIDWAGFAGDVALQKTTDLNNPQWETVTEPRMIYGFTQSVRLPRPAMATFYRVQPAP